MVAFPQTLTPFVCTWLVIRCSEQGAALRAGPQRGCLLHRVVLSGPSGGHISLQTGKAKTAQRKQHRCYPDPENRPWEERAQPRSSHRKPVRRRPGVIFSTSVPATERVLFTAQQKQFVLSGLKTCLGLSFLGVLSFQKALGAPHTARGGAGGASHPRSPLSMLLPPQVTQRALS